jgi:hypothetical protein
MIYLLTRRSQFPVSARDQLCSLTFFRFSRISQKIARILSKIDHDYLLLHPFQSTTYSYLYPGGPGFKLILRPESGYRDWGSLYSTSPAFRQVLYTVGLPEGW